MPTMSVSIYNPMLRPRGQLSLFTAGKVEWGKGLVVRTPNWLGDCLVSLPAMYKLRQLVPQGAGLFVVCRKSVASLWESVSWIDQVVVLKANHASTADRRRIRDLGAGVAVVLPNSFSSAFDMWHCGIPVRIGRAGNARNWLLTHTLPALHRPEGRAKHHQVANYLEIPAALGWLGWDVVHEPLVVADAAAIRESLGMVADRGPWLVIAPGAAYGPAKQWPVESFAEIARWWVALRGGSVAVTGTPAEAALADQASANTRGRGLNLAGKTDLRQLMAVLSGADKVVANDSGTMHLAAALGRQGVAIFGSTDPVATGPLGGHWVVERKELRCSPCFQRECPLKSGRYACLTTIAPEDVCNSLMALQGL
jgi:heptosyltransferase-2